MSRILHSIRRNRGFTLIELMIVVAIIGLLAALAIPNFIRFQAKARQSEARSTLRAIFTAERGYYADKLAYCTSFDTVGATVERGNRYLYTIVPAAVNPALRSAGTEIFAPGARTDCGGLTGLTDQNLVETVSDDSWTHGVPAAPFGVAPLGTTTFSPNLAGGIVPAGVGVTGAGPGCSAGQCEFVATAQSNIDNDLTYDGWAISSCGGLDTSYGAFAAGEPLNMIDDVSR
jgi:type IV pilus assembly protein PilA